MCRLRAAQGIVVHGAGSAAEALRAGLRPYFLDQSFPILTPQVLDPAHPFPFIPNRGLGVIFDLQRKATGDTVRELVMIPASLPRFAPVPGETTNFVPIEYLIELFADLLFPGFAIRARGVSARAHTPATPSKMHLYFAVFRLKTKTTDI